MKNNDEQIQWLGGDCAEVYKNIQDNLVKLEDFIGWIKQEKAHSYIDGLIRGSAVGELKGVT